MDVANAIECLRNNTKESLDEGTSGNACVVGEIAITLSTCSIVETHLSEIARTVTHIHLVHHIAFEDSISLVGLSCLEIGKHHIHDFG